MTEDFDVWMEKVGMLAQKLYNMEMDDLPFEFFWAEYQNHSTPRQALSQFEIMYL